MSQPSGPVSALPSSLEAYESVQLLADDIRDTCPAPVNTLQIAALLESAGVTDAIAAHRYGYRDVFGVADTVADLLDGAAFDCETQKEPVAGPSTDWRSATMNYLRGPLGVVPLVLLMSIVGALQNFGQWQGPRVLTLSAATIGSLLITGGFVQIASRKGSSYLSQGYARAAGRFVVRTLAVAVTVVVVTAFPLAWMGRATGWLAATDAPLMMIAYVALSCLWLLSAVLSIFKRVHWFGIALALGVGLSRLTLIGLARAALLPQVTVGVAVGVGLLVTIGVGAWAALRAVSAESSASESGDHVVRTPPLPQLVVGLTPYFIYGIIYILAVLSGHVGGWLGRLPAGLDRMDAIARSELGLTVALVAYILVGGVAEETMQRFWQWVHVYQAETDGGRARWLLGEAA